MSDYRLGKIVQDPAASRGTPRRIPNGCFVVQPVTPGRRVVLNRSSTHQYSVGDWIEFNVDSGGTHVFYSDHYRWSEVNLDSRNTGVDLAFHDLSVNELIIIGHWVLGDLKKLSGTEEVYRYRGGVVGGSYFYTATNATEVSVALDILTVSGEFVASTGKSLLSCVNESPDSQNRRELDLLLARELGRIPRPCFHIPKLLQDIVRQD